MNMTFENYFGTWKKKKWKKRKAEQFLIEDKCFSRFFHLIRFRFQGKFNFLINLWPSSKCVWDTKVGAAAVKLKNYGISQDRFWIEWQKKKQFSTNEIGEYIFRKRNKENGKMKCEVEREKEGKTEK